MYAIILLNSHTYIGLTYSNTYINSLDKILN